VAPGQPEGIEVARCTVERLMRADGLTEAVPGRTKRTTSAIPPPSGPGPWSTATSP